MNSETMTDDELDERLLALLRHARTEAAEGKGSGSAMSMSALASATGESSERVRKRLQALAIGQVKESPAAADRWMIVLQGDRSSPQGEDAEQ